MLETIQIADLLAVPIVGIGLSLAIQYLKSKAGTSGSKTKALTVVLALVLGGAYYFLRDTNFLATLYGILSASQVFWAFFLRDSTGQ